MISLALPPLYRPWLDAILQEPVESEPRATCQDCVMCSYNQRTAESDYYFNPNTKCCAYHPSLPNYLVGAILADDDPSFVEAKEHFSKGALTAEITPIGINPPYATELFYRLKDFGRYEQILCPFYMQNKGGACAIWKYRNGRCSTWFCKHERGSVGWKFWRKLDQMLNVAERELARKCMTDLRVIIPERPADVREQFWGNWMFREAEYFLECWKIVQPMNWETVLQIGGQDLQNLVSELISTFHQMKTPVLPEALRIGEYKLEQIGDGMVRIWGYSKYNPIDLPIHIADVLHFFDGRPVREVLHQIEKETSIQIDERLLLQLADYEILIAGGPVC